MSKKTINLDGVSTAKATGRNTRLSSSNQTPAPGLSTYNSVTGHLSKEAATILQTNVQTLTCNRKSSIPQLKLAITKQSSVGASIGARKILTSPGRKTLVRKNSKIIKDPLAQMLNPQPQSAR